MAPSKGEKGKSFSQPGAKGKKEGKKRPKADRKL